MTHAPTRIAITAGEPAGIGPDLCAYLSERAFDAELIIIGDADLIADRAAQRGISLSIRAYQPDQLQLHHAGELVVKHVPAASPVKPGTLDTANAEHVIQLLDVAIEGCQQGKFDAMVTAPLHKGIINDAGRHFTGHTEYLAEETGGHHPVMMLASTHLRVALVTTHAPLSAIPAMITRDLVKQVTRILDHDLKTRFGLAQPRIAVCGLNPHAGEGGHLGHEEIDTIIPALATLAEEGIQVRGPLPADTAFTPAQLAQADAVLAMYHDQGLPVLKHQGFGDAVNITLGLPIIRTSVDHGTALDLAGTGDIDPGSLMTAIETAIQMAKHSQK